MPSVFFRRIHDHLGELVRGTVEETLKMPKLRKQAFETAIIKRYRRSESENDKPFHFENMGPDADDPYAQFQLPDDLMW